jgi:DNA adenine methylase
LQRTPEIDPTVIVHPGGVRPFLKWAGGKRQLLPQLRRFVPSRFNAFHEPFVGSGAVFFNFWSTGLLGGRRGTLVDTNADLIGCYSAVVRDVEAVIRHLSQLAHGHEREGANHYYRVRDDLFNPARRTRGQSPLADYPADLAAMFIYLNRTGFNGLYRLNSQGAFNVPAGRYTNPRICDAPNLRAVARALGSPAVVLQHDDYASVLNVAGAEDYIYIDPPYAPVSVTASFTSYTSTGFSDADQRRLQEVVLELVGRGCWVVLSNSTAPLIADLYEGDERTRRAGLRAYRVPAKRAINSDPTARGDVMEFIVTNVQPRD